MAAQSDRDHCEPEERGAWTDKLKALLNEARKLRPDVSDYEFLAALEDHYRKYRRERSMAARKAGRAD